MSSFDNPKSCWPTRQQRQLLRAALLEGPEAIKAWREWSSAVNFDEIDAGSFGLLPLLYRNLHAQGFDHPLMGKYKGVYRLLWCKNQILLSKLAALLRVFQEAGIKTMVLKGGALILTNYRDAGLRMMDDVDVLVPIQKAPAAISVLQQLNWKPYRKAPDLNFSHAHMFTDSTEHKLDLHWHLLCNRREVDADKDFWAEAISINVKGEPTRALSPTDQLLHACVHGARWNPHPPLRWVADAITILKTSPEIDWNRLVNLAQKLRLSLPLSETLEFLHVELGAPIPPAALHSLQAIPTTRAERLIYRTITHYPDIWVTALSLLWIQPLCFLRSIGKAQFGLRFRHLARFLKHLWGVEHLWQAPFHAAFRITRRTCQTLGLGE